MTETFDIDAPAIVFLLDADTLTGDVIDKPEKLFPKLSEAIRFVMEDLHPTIQHTAWIITERGSLRIEGIETYYRRLTAEHPSREDGA